MSEPVTVAVTRTVRPGCESAFAAALQEFMSRTNQEPGLLTVHILKPEPGSASRDYGILRSFASAEARDAFYRSEPFRDWQRSVATLVEGEPRYDTVTGIEGWFTLPGRRLVEPPPRWKMATATLVGVYPTSLALGMILAPLTHGWPAWARGLVISLAMVVLLTWLVMPNVTRLLKPWLHPEAPATSSPVKT